MDIKYMKRALELAKNGSGYTNPNPLVGAVIVKDGRIIGEGYHQVYGSHHAEVNAFNNATEDVKGATMYVTLEPCSHFGKTPPCARAIVEKKIKKVIIGMKDPNPIVSGRGIKILTDNKIEVVCGVLAEEGIKLNEIFLKYITTKTPFCIIKSDMTLDCKLANYTDESELIKEELSRKYVEQIRQRVAGIMVGIEAVIENDFTFANSLKKMKAIEPTRIIVDSTARISLDAKVLNPNSSAEIIIVATTKADKYKIRALQKRGIHVILTPLKNGKVDLSFLMKALGELKIDSVLIEGGSELNYSALEERIVDKVNVFIAPKIMGKNVSRVSFGGEVLDNMAAAISLKRIDIKRFGDDIMIEGYTKEDVFKGTYIERGL